MVFFLCFGNKFDAKLSRPAVVRGVGGFPREEETKEEEDAREEKGGRASRPFRSGERGFFSLSLSSRLATFLIFLHTLFL